MNEDLLHYIWKFQLFNHSDLRLTNGEQIHVIHSGTHNFDSGPDFFNGQIKIGNTTWAGNIEIHTLSSHWYLHKHQENEVYDKIILHVVWSDNNPVHQLNGFPIPTVELKGLVSKSVISSYEQLQNSKSWIPCETEISNVEKLVIRQALSRNLFDRLERKTERINQLLSLNKNDWEETLYQLLAKYFGFKTNAVPFELLATSIPYNIVRKVQANEKQLTALLFGQAGFLDEEFNDSFPLELKKEYDFLKVKFQIDSLQKSLWKFMRMRPSNFPTIRLAQFTSIYVKNKQLFQRVIECNSVKELEELFYVKANQYWNSHFRFDVPSAKTEVRNLGKSSIQILLINVIIPILFSFGKKTGDEKYIDKAILFLDEIPYEKNTITKKWGEFGIKAETAFDSQALIQLKNEQCDVKNCLNCTIGNSILKS